MESLIDSLSLWYEKSPAARAIVVVLPLGAGLHEFLIAHAQATRETSDKLENNKPYLERLEQALAIDKFLLRSVRAMNPSTPKSTMNKTYKFALSGEAKDLGVDVGKMLSFLEAANTSSLFREKPFKPVLEINCLDINDTGISEISFKANNQLLTTIKNSRLLWPCNCKLKEYRISKKKNSSILSNCDIHDSPKGQELTDLFTNELVQIKFRNVKIIWQQHEELWPPSIDAFYFVNDLRNIGLTESKIKSVIDVGCGTGFMGIWLAKNNKSIKDLSFCDWLLSPLILTAINSSMNLDDTLVKRRYLLGLGFDWVNSRHIEPIHDMMICNPPYLPSLDGYSDLPIASTVFGTDLIDDVIKNGHNHARKVFLSFSNLAKREAEESASRWGKKLVAIGPAHIVPFRISHVCDNHDYIDELIDERGLKYKPQSDFPLQHSVQVFEVLQDVA